VGLAQRKAAVITWSAAAKRDATACRARHAGL